MLVDFFKKNDPKINSYRIKKADCYTISSKAYYQKLISQSLSFSALCNKNVYNFVKK